MSKTTVKDKSLKDVKSNALKIRLVEKPLQPVPVPPMPGLTQPEIELANSEAGQKRLVVAMAR
jgi:hypothetical protein